MPMYDINDNLITHKDVQDRLLWYVHGEEKEKIFVQLFQSQLGVTINPEKEHNPMAIDLINPTTNLLIDLKSANTPFFTSERKYNIPPQFAVTLNKKDVQRYQQNYPNMILYFWIDWIAVKYVSPSTNVRVDPMQGVWSVPLQAVLTMIENKQAPLHVYKDRQNDQRRNAKDSYILDIRHPSFQRVI